MKNSTKLALAAAAAAAAGAAATFGRDELVRRRVQRQSADFGTVTNDVVDVRATDGVRLHVEIDGDDLPGPTLVFSHGYSESTHVWHYPRLAWRGKHRMVFYDQRSHGKSGVADWRSVTFEQLAKDLNTVIEATCHGGPVILIGHSMGGVTVQALAGHFPELFGDQVKGAALVHTSSGRMLVTNPTFKRLAPLVRHGSLGIRAGRGLFARAVIVNFLTGPNVRSEDVDMIEEMVGHTRPSAFTHFAEMWTDFDTSFGFAALGKVPTVVVAGTHDRLLPHSHSRWIAKNIDGAVLETFEESGHFAMFEEREKFIDVLDDFFDKVAADL